MTELSHVGMMAEQCPVCMLVHETGILIHKGYKDALERQTVVGWGLCPIHLKQAEDGFVFAVEVDPPANVSTVSLEDAKRLDKIISIKREIFEDITGDKNVGLIMFMDTQAIKILEGMAHGTPTQGEALH